MIARLSKLVKIIINSRFKTIKETRLIRKRRLTCLACPFNSLNVKSLSKTQFFLTAASNFYSFLTGRKKEDTLGNCTACGGCSIYFKTAEDLETCPKKLWK